MLVEELQGTICDLERFAIDDAPGSRVLVHFKGCPLSCHWCSTPHAQNRAPEILHKESSCKSCGRCVRNCPLGAVSTSDNGDIVIDRELCDACGECVEFCPSDAREVTGRQVTVEELFKEIDGDPAICRQPNGVTVGGGEATMQPEFATAFLKRCKESSIHTTLETCGYARWEDLEAILEYVDFLYVDVKHMDDVMHRELTGVSNQKILENITKASERCAMIVRIPIVPGCSDSEENIRATAQFVIGLGENVQRIELIPYHTRGARQYDQLGMEYKLENVDAPDNDEMERLRHIVLSEGVDAQIGG